MLRLFVCAVFALVVSAGTLLADEVKGKIKSVDADKGTLTVTDDAGKDHVLKTGKDTKYTAASGKALEKGIKDGHLKADTEVVVTADKGTATEIKLAKPRKKS